MAKIHPTAIVGTNAQLAEDVEIGPLSVVGDGVTIGAGTVLEAKVVIADRVTIGEGNRFYPNSVIGCCPQVLGFDASSKIGTLVIGDRNVFRENVTIHPSRYEDASTVIGDENLIMVGTHIGHDCIIENRTVLSNSVQVGGHSKIEEGVWVSGVAGMHQFVTVGRWCFVAGLAGLTRDMPPFMMVSGHYPSCVRGVNKRGLQRAGLSEPQQEAIFEAYRRLYREGTPLLITARAMAQEDGLDENVRAIVDAILRSGEHRFGRYLETLRR
jgi:UDP-N-acetylglucosamine acyltransferase